MDVQLFAMRRWVCDTTGMNKRLRKADWEVRAAPLAVGQMLVKQYHYAKGGANTATYMHGLYKKGYRGGPDPCMGVAWWIPPTKSAANATYPEDWRKVLCLSRLVIVPGVPKNACSFLLARSRKLIPVDRWPCLVTYADSWQGHTGGIYRGDNWEYVGKTKAERTYVKDGRMIARKAGPKTRTHAEMLELGAELVGSFSKYKFVMVRE